MTTALCARCNQDVQQDHEDSSGKQRRGWHWLLGKWLELDPGVAKNQEALKTRLLILNWGALKVTDRHGNETLIALRRTTKYWDWESTPPGYRRKKVSKQDYTDLVQFTYDIASLDGVYLPKLDPRFSSEVNHIHMPVRSANEEAA